MSDTSIFKEVFDVISDAFKYVELDFYKLKSEVLSLIKKAENRGYEDPNYCSMKIRWVDKFQTLVTIEAYYDKRNGKFQKFNKELDLGALTNIPESIKKKLEEKGELEIRLTDVSKLLVVDQKDITPSIDFSNLYNFSFRNSQGTPIRKEIHFTNELFYFKVILRYIYEDSSREDRVKYFGIIKNMPETILKRISESENSSCSIEITE